MPGDQRIRVASDLHDRARAGPKDLLHEERLAAVLNLQPANSKVGSDGSDSSELEVGRHVQRRSDTDDVPDPVLPVTRVDRHVSQIRPSEREVRQPELPSVRDP